MSKFLNDCMEFIKAQPFEIIRITEMLADGTCETAEGIPAHPCQNVYSVAKSFTMTAIGLLYDKKLVGINEKICDIFADELPEIKDKRWFDCTVKQALTHSLGLPGGFLDIDVNPYRSFGEDFLAFTLSSELVYDPGTESRYSDGAFYLLARIAEKRSSMPLDLFLRRELKELCFGEMAVSRCPQGHFMGATGLYIGSEDMAKLGLLYLNNGVYGGKRLLSEEWCALVLENEFGFDWDETHTIYYKGGMCGQKLIVAPSQGRVVAVESCGADTGVIAEFVRTYKD